MIVKLAKDERTMWNRSSGKSDQSKDDSPSQRSRRNNEEPRHSAHRSGSIASSNSHKKVSPQTDDRDPQAFDPTSVSYSSTTRAQHPGAASAARAPSYATASRNDNGEPCMAFDIVRNVSLADQMPRSNVSRSSHDQDQAREVENKKRDMPERSDNRDYDVERQQKRNKRDKKDRKDKGSKQPGKGLQEELGTGRGPDDFHHQVATSGFSQSPGPYDGAIIGSNGTTHEHPALSSHVQDQFPGQFPAQSSAPYRPPLAASEGGPGLAADYYGDVGQSVAEQPGNRTDTPSLIIGAEPHLQPALAVAAPPPEPSASGVVGAAASFFSGEFEENEIASTHDQQISSTMAPDQTRPNSNHHSSSTPIISTLGGAAIGSVAGYLVDSQNLSHQQHSDHQPSIGGASSDYSSIVTHRPPSEMQHSQHFSSSQPPQPGKLPSQPSSASIYTAGVAGTADLAAAAYENGHHSSNQEFPSASQYSATAMSQRHRNRGPLSALIDFFKDPEGVAQFEEYSQIIGVCRHCFAPGSSPRDAPRKHFYGRRRSNERYGSSTRVDKDHRYYSSENEGRRKNKSWLGADLAEYGLGNSGQSTLHPKNYSNDSYNLISGRFSPDRRDRKAIRRSRSKERVAIEIVSNSKSDRRDSHGISNGTKTTTYSTRRHSRTRSRSKDQKSGVIEGAIGAALGVSVVASSSRRQNRSGQGTPIKNKHLTQASSPERRHSTKKKKKDRGFFSFANGSSSSSSVDLAFTGSQNKHRSSKISTSKSKDDKEAEAALLGLGAAAAALALNDGRPSHRKRGVRELVGVKETKMRDMHGLVQTHTSEKTSGNQDEELWESAAEDDYENMSSDLAYGAPIRRDSPASLSSESSGTNKWGWRWGSRKSRRPSVPQRKSSDHGSFPSVDGVTGAFQESTDLVSQNFPQGSAMNSTSSLPLRHVHPVPTSDPSRFDVGPEEPVVSSNRPPISSRPEAVPLQHPRPIAPVSAAIYSSQTAYDHSYSAPADIAALSQTPFHHYPGKFDVEHSTQATSTIGRPPRIEQQADDATRDVRIQRSDMSPTTHRADSLSNSMTLRRRNSTKDDSAAVRFNLTEEQEKRDRRERRRMRRKDKERREAEEQEQERRPASQEELIKEQGSKTGPEIGLENSESSWVDPAAAGVIGAVIASAAATKRSRSEETREERRERRRRERELEDEENDLKRSERRRRQRERDDQEVAIQEHRRLPDEASTSNEHVSYQGRSMKKEDMSVWQEVASTKQISSHENYGSFFTPLELLNKSSDEVKVSSANADADVDIDQIPQIVTVEPKRVHDLSDSPAFSFADTDMRIDPSKPSFSWKVPRLRLVEPTPPSSRGSTPIPRSEAAGDEGSEEPRKDRSPSKVKWADDQTRDHTDIAPKDDRDEFFEPPSDPIGFPRDTDKRDLPDDKGIPQNDPPIGTSSASYGSDVVFAATLAASAEDAGFDPSIIINNPTYRRRDSPPASNERSMPGKFDDKAEPRLKKKEGKRKGKFSGHQSQDDDLNERDDDAIVRDIISQVEESESQLSDQVRSENLDDKTKGTETSREAPNSQKRDVYESTTEELRPIPSTNNEADSGREFRKESKRDRTGSEEDVSTVPSISTPEASTNSNPKLQDKRKGSMWDRFLGKSTSSLSRENSAKDITEETILEDFERPEKKSKDFKQRASSPDRDNSCNGYDDNHSKDQTSVRFTTPSAPNRSIQGPSAQDQGTNLPSTFTDAVSVPKYLDDGVETEQAEEKQPESFLEMGPEPPPPPDTRVKDERSYALVETTSLPSSPCAEPETQGRRFSDAEIFSPTETTAVVPSSPTAVPFHFRLPGRSSSTPRSLSQTPISSDKSTADLSPKHKTRPRSMEFKSSKEIRPLWLVERHRSHQEPTLDETFPSLPSSHTTSRSSSIHNSDEREDHQNGDYELNETEHGPVEVGPAPLISTDGHSFDSNILDPQQATPTPSISQTSRIVQDSHSTQVYGDSSIDVSTEEQSKQPSSTLKGRDLVAVPEGYTAVPMNEPIQNIDQQRQDLSGEENDDLEHDLDDMAPDTLTCLPHNTLNQGEDFLPQRDKKMKKNKRKISQTLQETAQPSIAGAAGPKPSMNALNIEPLSPQLMRKIEEQDAQDAVDSWSPTVRPSAKGKKNKKSKSRALVKKLPEESGLPPNTYELAKHNVEDTLSAEGHGRDSLTQETSRGQAVNIMTAAAQDAIVVEPKASQYATVFEDLRREPKGKKENKSEKCLSQGDLQQDDLPLDSLQIKAFPTVDIAREGPLQDDLQTKTLPRDDFPQDNFQHDKTPLIDVQRNIGEFDQAKLPRNNSLQSQEPQESSMPDDLRSNSLSLLPLSAPATAIFGDSYLEKSNTCVQESPKVTLTSQNFNHGGLATAISPELELPSGAIPLPKIDDGHHILEERLRNPTPTSVDHFVCKENETAAERIGDVPHAQDSSTGSQRQSQNSPSSAEQVDPGMHSGAPSKNDLEKDEKAEHSLSVESIKTTEEQQRDRRLSSTVTPTTLIDWTKHLNDEAAIEVDESQAVGDESGKLTSRQKGKEEQRAKQSFSIENIETTEVQRPQLPPRTAASEVLEDHKAMQLTDESAVDVSQPKTGPLKKDWPELDSEKMVKLVEGKESETSHLGPGLDETDRRVEQQLDAPDESKERHPSLASTRTAQEVSAILGIGDSEASVIGRLKEAFRSESHEEQGSRKSSEDQMFGRDEQNTPSLAEPKTSHFVDGLENAHIHESFPTLGMSMADTGAAQTVQEVLAMQKNVIPATDSKSEAMVVSKGVEDKNIDMPTYEDEVGWDAPKKKKKGKKGSKSETFPRDSPEKIKRAEAAAPPIVNNNQLEQEPAADRPIEEDELDRDAPKKKKKGKKGRKDEVVSLGETVVIEPGEVYGPSAMKRPPLEQELMAKADDEVLSSQSKKDKKGKKGKRKGVSRAMSGFRDEDERNVVAAEVPQDEDNAEDLPVSVNNNEEDMKPSVVLPEVPQDVGKEKDFCANTCDSRNEYDHSVIRAEDIHNDDQVEDGPSVDRSLVTRDVREDVELNSVPTEALLDQDNAESLAAVRVPAMRAEGDTLGEVSELPLPAGSAQDDTNETFGQAPLGQEQHPMPLKGKKDKRKSKKSKKSNAFLLDHGESSTHGDEQTIGTQILRKDGPAQTFPSNVDVVKELEKPSPEIRLEQEENFLPTPKTKDNKKSKKFNALLLERDIPPTLGDGPESESKDLEKDLSKQTLPSSVGVARRSGTFGEGLPEEKKDRETEESQRFEWKGEDANAPSESKSARELSNDGELDSNIYTPEFSGIVDHERGESISRDLDRISTQAATPENPHKIISSATSSIEQLAGLPEETLASHGDAMKDNTVPAVATDLESPFSLKPSRKAQKQAKKSRQLSREEISQEPKTSLNEYDASEDTGEPSIIPVIQDNESRSKPEIYTQGIEPTEIVEPGIRSEENKGFRAGMLEEKPSQTTSDIQYIIEADEEDNLANVLKGKWRERTPEPEEDQSQIDPKESAWAMTTNPGQPYEQSSDQQPRNTMSIPGTMPSKQEKSAVGSKQEQDPILTESRTIKKAKDEGIPWDVSAQMAEKSQRQHDEMQGHELEIEDLSSSAASGPALETANTAPNKATFTHIEPAGNVNDNEPIPTTELTISDAQEQRGYNELYARELEREVPNAELVEPLGGCDIDKIAPVLEAEMLDAQEQREYNEEYTKELERQLNPLQQGEPADSSLDKANVAVFSASTLDTVLERPYEEEQRPSARPSTLENITEESRSRSGSVQSTPVDREDEYPTIKSSKKGKKGKKGKKRQPVIWEDETATPPLESESGQGEYRSSRSSEGPSSWATDAARPLDLEEHVEHRSSEDRTMASPIGDLNTTFKQSAIENDRSGDYFAVRPSRLAEEDVATEDAQEFRRALEAEPPYTSKSRPLAQSPQADQDRYISDDPMKAHIKDEELGPLAAGFHVDPITGAEPVGEQVEDDFDPTPIESTELDTRAEGKASAGEPDPQATEQEDVVDHSQDPQTPTGHNLKERSPPRQHSLQPPSGENVLSSVAEGKSTGPSKSGNIEGVAAAVSLGTGALAAESLSRRDSKKEGRHGKKVKGAGVWTDYEAETGEPDIDREMAVEEGEHRQTLESVSPKRASQHHQATPPRSPPPANYEAVADHPVVGSLGSASETLEYRDSAIYVSGSPMISEEIPYHRAVRDSGYPDTEASPTNDNEPGYLDAPMDLEMVITPGKDFDVHHETHEHQSSMSRNPLEISIEADSDYDVSVTRPKERRKRSRRRSGIAHDSDDSADSGFDVQRRRRRQAIAAEPREPSPVSSTTKDRSSALFDSSPSARHEVAVKPQDGDVSDVSRHYNPSGEKTTWSFDREETPQQGALEASREGRSESIPEVAPVLTGHSVSMSHREANGTSIFGGPRNHGDGILSPSRSPHSSDGRGRQRLITISENSADGSPLYKKDKRAMSDVGSPESGVKGRRILSPPVDDRIVKGYVTPHDPISREPWSIAGREGAAIGERSRSCNSDHLSALSSRRSTLPGIASEHGEGEYRTASAASMTSEKSIHAIIRTPDQVRSASGLSYRSSGTPPLRRVDRSASGDLRGASKKDQAKSHAKSKSEIEAEFHVGLPSSSTYDPVTDKGKSPADMADIYEGWGDVHGQSPMSPTRPPSMRKRQSMQILDLETRLDQIVSENRLMASQKLTAEKALQEQARDHSQERHAYEEAMQEHKTYLTQKDSELSELKKIIEHLHDQAAHLTEVNEGLASSRGVDEEHDHRYRQLQAEHAHTHKQWQQSTRELDNLKEQHTQLSTGMEDLVRHEVTVALEEKDLELRQLQSELGNAKQQVRNLQQQLLASRSSDDFVERDEDYFDSQCQSLCQHVQQWVLRFSKFSDMKACYLAREIHDEKVVDRMENAVLDGSDVDDYLSDRVKRRDVFMSVVMTMIWEFIFTRYLFGMDREQRQKLKNLEKTLQEVGPTSAVHKWRATTLTLLMKRESFANQRATDTEAVIHEIYDTLATFLPPPTHLVGQIQDSLRKVIDAAVDLSIEMRTQRAQYSMLPPLQPEYDTNGDLARKVYFNAITMNERSGATSSNEALQEQHAVVRMVLFPLVVQNEDDEEQIVVCPAQVLTAEGSRGKKTVRVMSAQGWRSEASFAGSDVRMEGGMI